MQQTDVVVGPGGQIDLVWRQSGETLGTVCYGTTG